MYWNYQIQTSQTGDQLYSDPSPMASVLWTYPSEFFVFMFKS